jgi:hypothetical protein
MDETIGSARKSRIERQDAPRLEVLEGNLKSVVGWRAEYGNVSKLPEYEF